MKKTILFLQLFFFCGMIQAQKPVYQIEKRPFGGFASIVSEGVDEVKGGEGGNVVRVESAAALSAALEKLRTDKPKNLPAPPTIFVFSGIYTHSSKMMDVKYLENATFVGDGTAVIQAFGFEFQHCKNVIVRNITFDGNERNNPHGSDDAFSIENSSHHIWIDHCTFTDYYDGCVDSKRAAHNLTYSWNHFYNHSKNCLVGHSDGETGDVAITITFHHNFFDGTAQRNPRVRFGKAHVYNNYYTGNSIYGVVSACNADVFVEGNYMENVQHPSYCGYDKSPVGDLEERNNVLVNSGTFVTHGTTFEPHDYYDYTVDDPHSLPEYIPANVGAGKFDFSYMWLGGEPSQTGISKPTGTAGVQSETYYNLSGMQMKTAPEKGIYIKRTVYKDGKSNVVKLLKNARD
jgi:pectate lyase